MKRPVSPLRVGFAVMSTIIAALLFLLVVDAAAFVHLALTRVAFPWADNQWSEGPLILQLYRLEHGGSAYPPARLADSFDYGPVYVYLLFTLRRILGLAFSTPSYRMISASFGMLAVIPFAICASIIAGRLGLRSLRVGAISVVLCSAALLAFSVLLRNITFDALHPDNLLALLLGCSLALYYALALRRIDARFIWALAAVSAVMVFTKQNSLVLFPILVLALWRTGALSGRLALASSGAFVAVLALALGLMPPDMRDWTFRVPGSHPYETQWPRLEDCFQIAFGLQAYITFGLALFALVVFLLAQRYGRDEYVLHGLPAAGILLTALSAYFKLYGVFNNLSIIALFSVPYCAALIGALTTPRFVMRAKLVAFAGAVLLVAVGKSLQNTAPRDAADPLMVRQMSAAESVLRALCARQKVLITFNPDLLFGCKNANFSLFFAYYELVGGRSGRGFGLTIFDRPTSYPYVVDTDYVSWWSIPRAWQRKFHIEKKLPAVLGLVGFENTYAPVKIRIWARNRTPFHPVPTSSSRAFRRDRKQPVVSIRWGYPNLISIPGIPSKVRRELRRAWVLTPPWLAEGGCSFVNPRHASVLSR